MTYYFIVNLDGCGDSALFWKPNESGYTNDIGWAGVYDEKETKGILGLRPGHDAAILVSTVKRYAVQVLPNKLVRELASDSDINL